MMCRVWGDMWQYPFLAQTWESVWTGVAAVGTIGTLLFTLILFRRDQWRSRSAEARQVMIWNQSPGASTDDGVHTYHNTFHLVNSSPRPIHDVRITLVLPSRREYNKRRKWVPNLDPPEYTREQWKTPPERLKDMTEFWWGGSFKENALPETVIPGGTLTKDIATPVPVRCVDLVVDFLDGDGQRWQRNASTGKLRLLD